MTHLAPNQKVLLLAMSYGGCAVFQVSGTQIENCLFGSLLQRLKMCTEFIQAFSCSNVELALHALSNVSWKFGSTLACTLEFVYLSL